MIVQGTFILLALIVAYSHAYSIQVPDGDTVDCIDIKSQPAFTHDLLKNHQFQEWPSEFPKTRNKKSKSNWPTWESHASEANCPKGSVPIRQDQSIVSNDISGFSIHEYAVARTNTPREIYGAEVTVNVWQPKLESENEMSISQIWLSSGAYDTNNLNTIEVGWQVLPQVYQDHKPRLFIFWTNDSYTTGCYNLQCPGFVQISNTIILGGVISPVSTYGGKQFEITISVWKDKKYGNWWLSLGPNNSLVGYWPGELFGNLTNHAEEVQWGGEILNTERFDRHTTTQMGSGHFPDEGFSKSSYFRNLKVIDSNNDLRQVENIDVLGHNQKFYDIKSMFSDDWGPYLFYGGSGFSRKHSGVDSLGFSSFLFYFSFLIFLMF